MSELQISLLGLGIAGIAAVWGYNKWQERAHRKAAERVFRGSQADVLLDDDAAPSAAAEGHPVDADPPEPVGRVEPVLGATADVAAEAAPEIPDAAETAPPVDEVVDCVALLEVAEPVSGQVLWEAQRPLAERLDPMLHWIGLDTSGNWYSLGPEGGGNYQRLCAMLQLADRQGPISEEKLALFYDGVTALAAQLVAVADLPPRQDVLTHARAIDGFCAAVDIQIAVHVVHRDGQALAGSKLRGLAEAGGLRWQDDGRFHRIDGNGASLFSLANLGSKPFAGADAQSLTTHGVTFWLDVPRVGDGPGTFSQMLAVARQLVSSLDGVLVDDQRNPLSDSVLAGIREKVAEIQAKMAAQGIPAGGVRALRLFS